MAAGAALGLALPRLAGGYLAIFQQAGVGSRTDFAWMYYAMHVAWMHLRAGMAASALYRLADQRAWMRAHAIPFSSLDLYSYPPPFALAFAPLGALGYRAARTVWTLLSLGWFLGALGFACGIADARRDWRVRALAAAAGLACFPALTTFYWGQTDTLILFLLASGLWCIYRGRRPGLGGALLALGALFKLTPAVVVAYYAGRWLLGRVLRRPAAHDATVVVGALGMAGGMGALTVALLGWAPLATYVAQVLPAVQQVALAVGPAPMEQSLRGVLLLFVPSGPALRAVVDGLSAAAPLALLAVAARSPRRDPRGEAAGVTLVSLVSAPSLEGHHFVVAALPEVVLGGWLLQRGGGRRWIPWAAYLVAVLLLTVPGYPFLPPIGKPLCALDGHPGWIAARSALVTACDGQRLWAVLLLFGLALTAAGAGAARGAADGCSVGE